MSPEAKDLICRLLCDVEHRLGTGGADQIKVYSWLTALVHFAQVLLIFFTSCNFYQAHPWFKDVIWDKLYEMEATF